ncbi:MAG: hypothetical protein ACFFB0_10375 [Promethearchaeota archaeon]
MKEKLSDSRIHPFLFRKLLTICPVCKKKIYGRDIDILKIDTSKITHWPLRYIHCHTNNDIPLHALTIFIDSNFSVRGNEVSSFLKIEK